MALQKTNVVRFIGFYFKEDGDVETVRLSEDIVVTDDASGVPVVIARSEGDLQGLDLSSAAVHAMLGDQVPGLLNKVKAQEVQLAELSSNLQDAQAKLAQALQVKP